MAMLTLEQEQLLDEFDANWYSGKQPDIHEYLARTGFDDLEVVAEFIKIDLEYHWRAASRETSRELAAGDFLEAPRPRNVSWYQQEFPVLARASTRLLGDLIVEEFRVRRRWGDAPSVDEILATYPGFEAISDRLQELAKGSGDESDSHPDPADLDCESWFSAPIIETTQDGGSDRTELAPNKLSGARLGDYQLLEEVARGGMGIVYRAQQLSVGRQVALKVIRSGEFANAKAIQRFRYEVRAIARLDHPGIVAVYDVGMAGGQHYFAMTFVDGTTLARLLEPGPVTPRRAAELTREIADALQYAHRHGIIHRDVKPANILLDRDGHARLTDFGLAREVGNGETLTEVGDIVGTPSYMPPEQASGKPVGPPADIYSTGAVLYALLTGRPPFQAASMLETLSQVIVRDPVSPRFLNDAVPRDLENICLKCLSKDPRHRYGTAAELVDDLQRFLNGVPTLARPISPVERFVRWCRRTPLTASLATAAVALAFLLVMALWFGYQNTNSALSRVAREKQAAIEARTAEAERAREAQEAGERERRSNLKTRAALEEAERNGYFSRIQLAQHEWSANRVAGAEGILDAIPLEFFFARELVGWEWHFLKRICHLDDASVQLSRPATFCMDIAPDGLRIATGHEDGRVSLWQSDDLTHVWTVAAHRNRVLRVCFAAGGDVLITAGDDGLIHVWDPQSDTPRSSMRGAAGSVHDLCLIPGRREFVSVGDAELRVWSLESGQMLRQTGLAADEILSVDAIQTPQGIWLAATTRTGRVAIWDADRLELQTSFQAHQGTAYCGRFSPADPSRLATCGEDEIVRIWDWKSGRELSRHRHHNGAVYSLEYSRDGRFLSAVSSDAACSVLDTSSTGRLIGMLRGHNASLYAASFSNDASRLFTVGRESILKRWNTQSMFEYQEVATGLTGISHLIPDHNADSVLVVGKNQIRRMTLVSSSADDSLDVNEFARGQSRITATDSDAGGESLAVGFASGLVQILRNDAQPIHELNAHADSVECIRFLKHDALVASGSLDRRIRIWELETGHLVLTLEEHAAGIRSIDCHPEEPLLVSVDYAGTTLVWDATSGHRIHSIQLPGDQITEAVFHPDGVRLMVACESGSVHVFETRSWRQLRSTQFHSKRITQLEFDQTGRRFVTSSLDGTIRLWDAQVTQPFLSLSADGQSFTCVDFAGDDRFLVGCTTRGNLLIWDSAPKPVDVSMPRLDDPSVNTAD